MLWFFFKQKTAYEIRISDWSSDVCSSDLLAAVRPVAAVGDEVDAELALGGLDHRVGVARRDVVALGVELEVVNQGFHRALHLGAPRRRDLVIRNLPLAGRHLLDALALDAHDLAHPLDADEIRAGTGAVYDEPGEWVSGV